MSDNPNKINCFKCKHFVITWETKTPKACALFGFKSANMPSDVVFRSSGEQCSGFTPKGN
jgi:hypothetical protein